MTQTDAETHVLDGFPAVALAFYRAMELNRRRVAGENGLSEMELRAVFRVGAAGSISPKQLASDLAVTNGALTGIASRLVAAGHVHRVEHSGDRRRLWLELSAAGHALMRTIHDDFRAVLSTDDLDLSDRDLDSAMAVLEAVGRQLVKASL